MITVTINLFTKGIFFDRFHQKFYFNISQCLIRYFNISIQWRFFSSCCLKYGVHVVVSLKNLEDLESAPYPSIQMKATFLYFFLNVGTINIKISIRSILFWSYNHIYMVHQIFPTFHLDQLPTIGREDLIMTTVLAENAAYP